ncbi:YopX protein [Streptococcus pneumoniae]|nr:YopX protein [Streptococcus pneumoniae]
MILKYRAWDSWRKRMSVVDRIYIDTEGVRLYDDFGEYWRDFRDIKLMQSTGLTDKNGKEIFDGDIVRTTRFLGRADEIGGFYEYEKDYVGVVKVLEGSWVIDTGSVAVRLWSEIDESEVLGNIYENPELLEDE